MKIEFDLPEVTIRQIKALSVLTGQPSNDVAMMVGELISQGLRQKLAEAIGFSPSGEFAGGLIPMPEAPTPRGPRVEAQNPPKEIGGRDVTGISDGLGDDDVEDPEIIAGLKDMNAAIPAGVGPSEDELNREMAVEDPQAEAKGSAETFGAQILKAHQDQDSGVGLFAEIAGIDDRVTKRKKRLTGSRGKVTPLEHNFRESDPT